MDRQILIKPLITEKSMQNIADGWYTFIVDKTATKGEIAQAVASQFPVQVNQVRTITVKGKTRRSLRKRNLTTRTSDYKKALVRLKKGEKIDIFMAEQPAAKK